MAHYICDHLLLPAGFVSPGFLEIVDGAIVAAGPAVRGLSGAEPIPGYVLPGMPNTHSHAFQRGLVGLTEGMEPGRSDSFWTWRSQMYELALRITPSQLEAIAAQLFVEMLEGGYTSVGEFHYLHHDPAGAPYANPAELSFRIASAADATGIALTLLPVLYGAGGFGKMPKPEQRRFVLSVDAFLTLFEKLRAQLPNVRVGIAPHSLRAVPARELSEVIVGARSIDPGCPIHIHVAEQELEVEESRQFLGARPVRWLLERFELDESFCLVHATHMDDEEIEGLARSPAVVGLCPTTEANLGDGLFAADRFLEQGGRFGVGSDSQVAVSAVGELCAIEYAQRLWHRRRSVLAPRGDLGLSLYTRAAQGGAQALGRAVGALAPGRRADLVVLDADHPRLVHHTPKTILDAWIFGAPDGVIAQVMVEGRWVVKMGRHIARDQIADRFRRELRVRS